MTKPYAFSSSARPRTLSQRRPRPYATVHGQASHFVWLNRGKESIELDLASDRGRETALALADRADVVISNLAPGAMDRLGLGADTLRERRPDGCSGRWPCT